MDGRTESVRGRWRARAAALAELAYPRRCWLCAGAAEADGAACDEHAFALGFDGPRCGRCLAGLGDGVRDGTRCPDCRRGAPAFARTFAVGPYVAGGALAAWVFALKYGGRLDLAGPLGRALAARVPTDLDVGTRGAVVVPVPLHPLRRLERGYDQAEALACALGLARGLPVVRALARVRRTDPQGSVLGRSRAANVARAFRVRRPGAALAGRGVVLVDDVATSGATADACARALRAAGAGPVHLAVVARAGAGGDARGAAGGQAP